MKLFSSSRHSYSPFFQGTWGYFEQFARWRRERRVVERLVESAQLELTTGLRVATELLQEEDSKRRKRVKDVIYARRKRQKGKVQTETLNEQIETLRQQRKGLVDEQAKLISLHEKARVILKSELGVSLPALQPTGHAVLLPQPQVNLPSLGALGAMLGGSQNTFQFSQSGQFQNLQQQLQAAQSDPRLLPVQSLGGLPSIASNSFLAFGGAPTSSPYGSLPVIQSTASTPFPPVTPGANQLQQNILALLSRRRQEEAELMRSLLNHPVPPETLMPATMTTPPQSGQAMTPSAQQQAREHSLEAAVYASALQQRVTSLSHNSHQTPPTSRPPTSTQQSLPFFQTTSPGPQNFQWQGQTPSTTVHGHFNPMIPLSQPQQYQNAGIGQHNLLSSVPNLGPAELESLIGSAMTGGLPTESSKEEEDSKPPAK